MGSRDYYLAPPQRPQPLGLLGSWVQGENVTSWGDGAKQQNLPGLGLEGSWYLDLTGTEEEEAPERWVEELGGRG